MERIGKVIVAGGGMGGLAAAAALARSGFEVEVHERRDELREEGGAIAMHENLVRALGVVGAAEHAAAHGDLKHHFEYCDHRGRRHAPATRNLTGGRYYYVSRHDVHGALRRAAETANVRLFAGSPIVAVDRAGTVRLATGRELHGDLVVVADGVASALRDQLAIRVDVRRIAHWGLREPLDYDLPEALPGYFYERWHGTKRLGYGRLGAGRSATFLSGNIEDLTPDRTELDSTAWVHAFPDQANIIRQVAERRPRISMLSEVTCSSWSDGRVVLVGDAAHATPPHRGQGAAMAVQDGVYLGVLLRPIGDLGDLQAVRRALWRWETDLRPIVRRVQRNSMLYCRAQSWWPHPLLGLRPMFFRAIAKRTRRVDLPLLEPARPPPSPADR